MNAHSRAFRRSFPDLKTWRTALMFSQSEAAAHLGVSQKTYSRWETGQRFVSGQKAKHLMDRTGVPLEKLAGVA